MAYDHVYIIMLLIQGSSISKMSAEYMLYCSCVRVEYYFNSGHQKSSQPFIVDCMFRPL